ncbi:hypothetical protein ISS37_10640 [candidate division KSB1 bacterium]|nr:hypothetical protein [candidate division KSB1 bacterium]
MYDSKRLNSLNLFQRTSFYINIEPGKLKHLELKDLLPLREGANIVLNRADAVLYRLERIYEIKAQILEILARCSKGLNVKSHQVMVWAPQVNELIFELTSTFVNLRLMMNAVLRLWFLKEGITNAPKSIRDVMKSLQSNRERVWVKKIPSDVKTALMHFWNEFGKKLIDYRDIDQHYDVLARQCIVSYQINIPNELEVLLPDNPETKSPKNFSFDKRIFGIELAQCAFEELHNFVETYVVPKGVEQAPLGCSINAKPSIVANKYVGATLGISFMNRSGSLSSEFYQSPEGTVNIAIRKSFPQKGDRSNGNGG